MSDVMTLAENLGFLELPPDSIRPGEIRGEAYAFRWDEIDTPPCPLGIFEYDLQVNTGIDWFDAYPHLRGNDPVLSGQRRRVLILMPSFPARFRVEVKRWVATPQQMQSIDRDVLLRILESPLQAVRDTGLALFAKFDRKRVG